LPYFAKERILLFAYNKKKDNRHLLEFNKIINYKPCEYSNLKLWTLTEYNVDYIRLVMRAREIKSKQN